MNLVLLSKIRYHIQFPISINIYLMLSSIIILLIDIKVLDNVLNSKI